MRIQTNTNALNALRNVGVTEMQQGRSIEKLSSGFRLNRAGDDAAGMSIANTLRSNGRGLQQAQRNASQASSFLQIADGGVQTLSTMLDRMRELATEAGSDNVTTADRSKITSEFKSLQDEWDRTITSTTYQGQALLSGTFGATGTVSVVAGLSYSNVNVAQAAAGTFALAQTGTKVTMTNSTSTVSQTIDAASFGTTGGTFNFDKLGISFSVSGDLSTGTPLNTKSVVVSGGTAAAFRVGGGTGNMASDDIVSVSLDNLTASTVGIDSTAIADLNTTTNAAAALGKINIALGKVNDAIGHIGAAQNRLDYATANVNSLYQNTAAAESVIRDVDMAQEYANYSKLNILQQAGTAMLAQANSSQQSVLQLLR